MANTIVKVTAQQHHACHSFGAQVCGLLFNKQSKISCININTNTVPVTSSCKQKVQSSTLATVWCNWDATAKSNCYIIESKLGIVTAWKSFLIWSSLQTKNNFSVYTEMLSTKFHKNVWNLPAAKATAQTHASTLFERF